MLLYGPQCSATRAELTDPHEKMEQADELVSVWKKPRHWRDGDREENEQAGMTV